MKILFVQYGNFAEAYVGFQNGAQETYRDQRRSVDYVAALADHHQVTILVLATDPFDTTLADNLRVAGTRYDDLDAKGIATILDRDRPDVVIAGHRILRFCAN
jgi:hypothetical protein